LQLALSVTGVAKLSEEGFDPIVEQTFGSPPAMSVLSYRLYLSGMLAGLERQYDYAASVSIGKPLGRSRNRSTRHNPGVGIAAALPLAAVTMLLFHGIPSSSRKRNNDSR
jgi:hypothetical protein